MNKKEEVLKMGRAFILPLIILMAISPLYSQPPKSFGGVWLGQTTYNDSGTNSLNVGSFYLAQSPFLTGLYFGYGVSVNTNVVAESAAGVDSGGNFIAATATGIGVHLPFEVNVAYVLSLGKFNAWAGGGLNASIAQGQVYLSLADLTNSIYCEASATGQTKFSPGAQLFLGGEYVFGRIPYIGGNWGLFLQYKYMYVNKMNMKVSGSAQCVDSLGNSSTQSIDTSIDLDLSNNSFVLGFTYHF